MYGFDHVWYALNISVPIEEFPVFTNGTTTGRDCFPICR